MKKTYTYIILLGLLITFMGCGNKSSFSNQIESNQSLEKLLENAAKSKPYKIDPKDWEVLIKSEDEGQLYYSLQKVKNDTNEALNITLYKADNEITIDSYKKEFFQEDHLKHHLQLREDTFYYYLENAKGEKEFILGEYNYRFTFGKLKPDELDYYILYQDSLGKIRGSRLPELPTKLSKEEESILDSM